LVEDEDDELDVESAAVIVVNDPLVAELDAGTELEAAAPAGDELVNDVVMLGELGEPDELDRLDELDTLDTLDMLDELAELDELERLDRLDELDEVDRLDELGKLDTPPVLEIDVVGLGTAELEVWLDPVDELGLIMKDTAEDTLDDWLEIDELLAEEADDTGELFDCDVLEGDKKFEKTLLAEDDVGEDEADNEGEGEDANEADKGEELD
ncbi:hypothetical protein KCU77_g17130, partial [Aureobasidium melanogenum]